MVYDPLQPPMTARFKLLTRYPFFRLTRKGKKLLFQAVEPKPVKYASASAAGQHNEIPIHTTPNDRKQNSMVFLYS
jgi:hypothetical protein